jgi:hypothetical protein
MNRAQRMIVGLILAGAAIVVVLSSAVEGSTLVELYAKTATSPLFSSTALAISILAFRHVKIVQLLLIGAALSAAVMILLPMRGNDLSTSWIPATLGVWCSSILVSGYRSVKANGAERLREFDRTVVIVALPLVVPVTSVGLWLTTQIVKRTYDNYFYAFDGLLPIPAARILAQFCASHPWAWAASTLVYSCFLLVLCIFTALQWHHYREVPARVLSRWVVATLLGYGLYFCLPGVGPGVAFYGASAPHFDSLPSPYQVELTLLGGFEGAPRNAMPSLHATWAFLIALAALRMAFWVRIFGAFYAIATAIVTLGLQEHYLIDLIVAMPLAVAVHAGTGLLEQKKETNAQLQAALGGAAMTVAWLFIIPYGTASLRNAPEIASALVLATLAASVWLVYRSETEGLKVAKRYHNREIAKSEPAFGT